MDALRAEDLAWADYVFISAMDVQRESTRRLLGRCQQAGVKTVAGGPLFTTGPVEFDDVTALFSRRPRAQLLQGQAVERQRLGRADALAVPHSLPQVVQSRVVNYAGTLAEAGVKDKVTPEGGGLPPSAPLQGRGETN